EGVAEHEREEEVGHPWAQHEEDRSGGRDPRGRTEASERVGGRAQEEKGLQEQKPLVPVAEDDLERRVHIEGNAAPDLHRVAEPPVRIPQWQLAGGQPTAEPRAEGEVDRLDIRVEQLEPMSEQIAHEEGGEARQQQGRKEAGQALPSRWASRPA